MDRREFMKSVGVAGGLATGLSAVSGGMMSSTAKAAHHEEADASGSVARGAMHALLDTIRETEARLLTAERGYTDPEEIGEAQRSMAHILQTALAFWLEADPERPVFQRYVTPTRKLLGDNPDSIYYFAPIRDDRSYRVTGNVGAAVFTSFTVERGSHDGHAARGSVASLSDNEMVVEKDGSYEVIISREKPASGNWLKLSPGASQITTRHYHEARQSIAATPRDRIVLVVFIVGLRMGLCLLSPKTMCAIGAECKARSDGPQVLSMMRVEKVSNARAAHSAAVAQRW